MRLTLMLFLLVVLPAGLYLWLGTDREPLGPARDLPVDLSPRAPDPGTPPSDGPPAVVPKVFQANGPVVIDVHVVRRGGASARARVSLIRAPKRAYRSAGVWWVRESEPEVIATLSTGPAGRCEFRGLATGAYEVRAVGLYRGFAEKRVSGRGPRSVVRLELVEARNDLPGRARYEDGRPFVGEVAADRSIGPVVRTGADGAFRLLGLTEGRAIVRFRDPGRLIAIRRVMVPVTGEWQVIVDEGFEPVTGRVLAADDGTPITDARVWVRGDGLVSTTTDADGRFLLRAPPGRQLLVEASAEGFALVRREILRETEIEIRLPRRATLSGRVVDRSGTPVAGVPVSVVNSGHPEEGERTQASGLDGRFRFEGICPGAMTVTARGTGWVGEGVPGRISWSVNPDVVTVKPGGNEEIEIVVIRAGRLSGVVRDADGQPCPGVPLSMGPPDRWAGYRTEASTLTDEEGGFHIGDLVPGFPYHVTALRESGVPVRVGPVTVASGETAEIEVVFPAPRFVELLVQTEGAGDPVVRAGVTVTQDGSVAHFQTGADGRARLGPLAPGVARIRIDHGACLCPKDPVVVTPGQTGLRVTLSPALFIEGRVVTEDGTAFTEGTAHIEGAADLQGKYATVVSGRLGAEGTFRLGPLPAGTWELQVIDRRRPRPVVAVRQAVAAGTREVLMRVPAAVDPGEEAAEPDHGELHVCFVGPDGTPAVEGWTATAAAGVGPALQKFQENPGEVRYRILRPGAQVWIEIWGAATGTGEALGAVVVGPFAAAPGKREVRLPVPGTIEGRVVDETGRAVAGLSVNARRKPVGKFDSATGHGGARTAKDGSFVIRGTGDLAYEIVARAPPGYVKPDPVAARSGAREIEIRLVPAKPLGVRVLLPDGQPCARATVVAVRLPDRRKTARAFCRDGRATFDRLDPARDHDLRIVGVEGGLAWSAERVRPSKGEVVARLAPGLSIAGRFEVPEGALRFEVSAYLEGSHVEGTATADGVFSIPGLTPGRWSVSLIASVGGKSRSARKEVDAGGEADLVLAPR